MAALINHSFRRLMSQTAQNVRVQGPSAVSGGHEGGYKVWRNISFFVAFPAIVLCAVNCYMEHQKHHGERPEFVKYEYMAMRSKRFPWGDGNHSFFHNPHTNALPSGYEDEH